MSDRLYFGCRGMSAGHWLVDESGKSLRFNQGYKGEQRGWDVFGHVKLDGEFTPDLDREHGAAALTFFDGWTILAFHDYSRDSRPGSNAAFLWRGEHTADEMLAEWRSGPHRYELEPIEAMGPIRVVAIRGATIGKQP